ncbi:MAG: hypothetical protein WCO65_02830 [bacterium]
MDKEDRPVEIKDLNKTQLILLSILLSFVVSIATGIMTVSLLQRAPQAVTQTINRVVQQTIEKAVPDYIPGQTQTVIVKEDDLVVDAVTKTRSNIFPIFSTGDSKDSLMDAYSAGNGIFVAKSDGLDNSKSYVVKNKDIVLPVKVIAVSDNGIALLGPVDPANKLAANFPSSLFGKDVDVKAGQTVIAISNGLIYKNIVQNILFSKQKDTGSTPVTSDVWNTIVLANEISINLNGVPVANLDGNVIGFVSAQSTADGLSKPQIIGINAIQKMISEYQKNPTVSASTSTAVH